MSAVCVFVDVDYMPNYLFIWILFDFLFYCFPKGDEPRLTVVQRQGDSWKGRGKPASSSRVEQIVVISSRQCLHTRYYTGKNSYFYLILADRPRSDAVREKGSPFIPPVVQNDCGFTQ